MRRRIAPWAVALLLIACLWLLAGCGAGPQEAAVSASPTASPASADTPTPTPAPDDTPTPAPSPSTAADDPDANGDEAPEESADPDAVATPVPLDYLFEITVHPPTCQSNGYSVYVSRETGGINIRDEVSKLPHDWVEIPGEDGEIEYRCSMCGATPAPLDRPNR